MLFPRRWNFFCPLFFFFFLSLCPSFFGLLFLSLYRDGSLAFNSFFLISWNERGLGKEALRFVVRDSTDAAVQSYRRKRHREREEEGEGRGGEGRRGSGKRREREEEKEGDRELWKPEVKEGDGEERIVKKKRENDRGNTEIINSIEREAEKERKRDGTRVEGGRVDEGEEKEER